MTKRRLILVIVALLALIGASVVAINVRMERQRTEENLARQAAEIAAHRQAQRAETPAASSPTSSVTPSVTPSGESTGAPAVAPAPDPVAAPAIVWTNDWMDFRGARRDGHYTAAPIRTDWAALKPLWKQPVGGGHASFVVADGRAFTVEQRGLDEVAAAYDVLTGRELWTNARPGIFNESYSGAGPRATPTLHDGTLFVLGGAGELRAIDASNGKLRWRTNILEDADADNLYWGMSASPLVVGNAVVTVPGGGDGRSIVAYDLDTGRIAWSALDDDAAYSSPMRVTLAGVDQIVVFLAERVVGISPDRGALLWEFPWPTNDGINAAQPLIIGDNRVFISSGYGEGGALVEIARDGDRLTTREVWRTNRMKNTFTTSVYHDGFIYGLDETILACIDASSGELKWKGGRYGQGQVLLASGHLIVTTEDGELVLVRATPEGHQELARVSAVEGRTWNHPALADGFLLIRNGAQMAAFDLRDNHPSSR
jgi:outer membrane protein assembly factor BamB